MRIKKIIGSILLCCGFLLVASSQSVVARDVPPAVKENNSTLTVDKKVYEYGETVVLTFAAAQKKESSESSETYAERIAQENTADFYYGNTLLGSAEMTNGTAVLNYDTKKCQIPVGEVDITVDFGGNDQSEAVKFTERSLFTLNKKKLTKSDVASISLKDFVYDGNTRVTEITGITWADSTIQNLDFKGKAELPTSNAGVYNTADIISLNFTGQGIDWYDVSELLSGTLTNVPVEPTVMIEKAESEGKVFRTLIFNKNEKSYTVQFDKTMIPDGYELDAAELGDTAGYGQLLKNVQVNNDNVSFELSDVVQEGDGIIQVGLIFKNHKDINLELKVIKTSKEKVNPGFRLSDMEYTGSGYDNWGVAEGYSKDQIKATYRNLDSGTDLGSTAPVAVGNYSVTLRFETEKELAEETYKFTIEKRQITLKALDRKIKIGDNAPDLSSPVEGVDYEFRLGKPNRGESVGIIKMSYAETPNTSQTGTYEIQIEITGNVNPNYSVKTESGQLEVVQEETPEIKPPSESESPDSENNNKTDDKLQDKNQEKKKSSDIPKTGDDNKLAATGIMSLISLAVIMLLLFCKRRKNL